MASSADIGIFTTDCSLVVTSWDDWLVSTSGISRESAIGREIGALLPELERRGFLDRLRTVLDAGTVEVLSAALHHYLIEVPPRAPSARFARMQQRVTIAPLLQDRAIAGVVVTVEDVTARLDAERDLAEQASSRDGLGSEDWRIRQAAVQRLATEADANFVHALIANLREHHRDFNLLSSALMLLGSTNVEVTGVLAELLHEPDADLRIQVALALGTQHDAAAVAPLRAALADPDVNVRFQAIESLGRLRAEAALDDLLTIVESQDYFLAFAALDAVAAISDTRVSSRLVPLLESDTLRVPVAETLGSLGDERAVPALVTALDESSRGAASIASALVRIHDRFEREYRDGARIVDRVRSQAQPSANVTRALVHAIPAAGRDELAALVRVLGWLDGDEVEAALTRLLGDARVRAEVVEALVRHGDGVVERLVDQLDHEDREIRHAAIVALGRLGSPRATPALVSLLDADGHLLVAAAGALARIGDRSAFEPLLALLGHHDGAVRQSAIGALNSIGHPDLAARVGALLTDPNPLARESAVKIAGYFGYAQTVDELFARVADENEAVRRAALEHVTFADEARALPVLLTALATETPRARAAAVRALGRVDAAPASDALLSALRDEDAWVRYFAVRGLMEQRHAAAGGALIAVAERDPANHVRIAALDALGAFGAREAMPILRQLVGDDDQEIAAAALSALGAVADADGLQALFEAVRAESPVRRLAAVRALAAHGSKDAVGSLEWTAATDADPEVSGAAMRSLGEVAAGRTGGADAAVDALLTLLSDPERREAATRAIATLPASAIDRLSRGLQHPQPDVRSATVAVLGRFQCEDATQVVATALADVAASVRETAVLTLGRLGARKMESRLAELSASDPSKAVRRAAAMALSGLQA